MQTRVLGQSLAHGIAHRSGREGNQILLQRAHGVQERALRSPGKQSRNARFRRWKRIIESIYGDYLLLQDQQGVGKKRRALYLVLEPAPQGTHTVSMTEISVRQPTPCHRPLVRFSRHATARLMQSLGQTDASALFRSIRTTLLKLHAETPQRAVSDELVLIDPVAGWMPSRMSTAGILEVRTVIPQAALSNPAKHRMFAHAAARGDRVLLEMNTVGDPRSSRAAARMRQEAGETP